FDYLRDNMAQAPQEMVQRKLNFAIIDEVDSVLIDEARTPLIISGPSEESIEIYYQVDRVARKLKQGEDYEVDEKSKSVVLTEKGINKAEEFLGVNNLYDTRFMDLAHCLIQALRAHKCFEKDVDYLVKNGQVLIVDEFTGRLLPGRRFSEGLHQALEAKEGVKIEKENQTLATITFQNYFRLYEKISGMTGTAATEAEEFYKIYDLEVVVIPPNKPLRRTEYPDVIYKTREEMLNAAIKEIKELHKKGRPVLVGTLSIEMSENLSNRLRKEGIKHEVLNAKHHEREARIIARAGERGAVTIATQMAGRGTDIKLGEGVAELGGLHILGVERHEARRIDNQLRGRAGRQGDPGSSRFYLSLEDDLLRIFGGDRLKGIMERLGLPEGEPITHPWITRAIENAQKRVEAYHFDIRKTLLEFDDVMDKQREVIYQERRKELEGKDLREDIEDMLREIIKEKVSFFTYSSHPEEWDWEGLRKWVSGIFSFALPEQNLEEVTREKVEELIFQQAWSKFQEKEKTLGEEMMEELERVVLLRTIDRHWKEHLRSMDELREGIGLRAYGQRDPVIEYKNEAFALFQEMIKKIREETIEFLFRMEYAPIEMVTASQNLSFQHPGEWLPLPGRAPEQPSSPVHAIASGEGKIRPYRRETPKIGRNEPCPCGSGKKYKHCCGRNV
ncbi:SEC-C domain-containing protein, partial [Candidatus Calescamantes bacterium]|nr:SEC-C domain-containing protein [Candidatus Calescamantes bacterium]